jgi:hypothetical protein
MSLRHINKTIKREVGLPSSGIIFALDETNIGISTNGQHFNLTRFRDFKSTLTD